MDKIDEFVDERNKSSCIQCGAWIDEVATSKDHVPSKVLLRRPHPEHLPVVAICAACNNGFSADEEYLALFLQCVLVGSTNPKWHTDDKIARSLRRHTKLRGRIDRSKIEFATVDGETRIAWKPEAERVKRIVVKNARGHAFYEYGEPLLVDPEHVWARPLETMTAIEREEFDSVTPAGFPAPWPEVGSRMMTRVLTGQDMRDGWVIVQDGIYRFRAEQSGAMLVRSVLFEYLATEVYWSHS